MYSTIDDIKDDLTETTLMEMTDDSDEPVAISDSLVEKKISESEALINSFVKRVATLPITDSEDLIILKSISVSLTVCELWRRRSQTDYPEPIAFRKNEAMKLLDNIGSGKSKLNTPLIVDSEIISEFAVSKKEKIFRTDYFSR